MPAPAPTAATPTSTPPATLAELRHQVADLTSRLAGRDGFIAAVGHELRNAVAPLLLLSEQLGLLAQRVAEPAIAAQLPSRVAILGRSLDKFVSTIDRVSEVAQLRDGRLVLDCETVDLAAVAREVCAGYAREATAAGAVLEVIASGPVTGHWDRTRLAQIVGSLVSNAIRYAGGGAVRIEVTATDTDAQLVVQDDGPGIAPAARDTLFEQFEHRTRRGSGGFGVGLYVVRTLCTAMGGGIRLAAGEAPGARFIATLPRG